MMDSGWQALQKLIRNWRRSLKRQALHASRAGESAFGANKELAGQQTGVPVRIARQKEQAQPASSTDAALPPMQRQVLLPAYRPPLQLPPPSASASPEPDPHKRDTAATPRTARRRALPAGTKPQAANRPGRRIALALQGGGAHGAFTWGVLDRLLDEPEIDITAISGSSAGALNAVALASGLLEDGRAGAKRRLDQLWRRAAGLAELSSLPSTPLERLAPSLGVDWSPGHMLFDIFTRYVSPYQFNPFGIDPLRQLLHDLIDIGTLRRDEALPLFIAATRVDNGEMRLFENRDLSIDAILASACLPAINQAIKIDDGYYWDGGFSANPPLLPLVSHSLASPGPAAEILLVRVDPVQDDHMPITAGGIRNRLNRLMFNAPLNAELRSVRWLQDQLSQPALAQSPLGQQLATLKLHSLSADDVMRQLGSASKLRPDLQLIERLHQLGREVADTWIEQLNAPQARPRMARPA